MKFVVRRLAVDDLPAYKALRDEMLLAHPDAFTSDATTERPKAPMAYMGRLGLDRPGGGHFLLGAFVGAQLVGALGCDRDHRPKVQHLAQVVGMMVRPEWRSRGVAQALLLECIARARAAGIDTLTLSVTVGNGSAQRLYDRMGFVRYGMLEDAVREGGRSHDKALMALRLR